MVTNDLVNCPREGKSKKGLKFMIVTEVLTE